VLQQNKSENRQVNRTRNWIFEALIILMKETPYEEISISAIADRAGVARQSFYRNFTSRDDIIVKFFEQVFHEFVNDSKHDSVVDAKKMYELYFATLYKRKEALLTINRASLDYLIFKILLSYSEYFKRYALQLNSNEYQILKDYFIEYQFGGILAITMEWIEKGMNEAPDKLGQITYSICKSFENNSCHVTELMKFAKP
jgi:AcrR family transcriptional regulator